VFSVNQQAVKIVKEKILPFAEQLNCKIHHLKNGATVVDMGVEAPGGYQAGKLIVEATIGGMGHINFGEYRLEDIHLPSIDVYIDHPVEATLSSQFSGWKMPGKEIPGYINPIGSGPARAIARNDIFSQSWHYQDINHETVFAAQTQEIPDESVAEMVAEGCKLPVENVYILATKTASLAGSIQVCSRTVEASLWRLYRKGLDIGKIISGMGTCPIAPPIKDELKAMDRVNTALLYGVTVRYVVDCSDEEIEPVIDTAPFSASRRYGERFIDIFEEGKRDFYIVDKDIHTVARYEITNYATGKTFMGGILRADMMRESFYGD
jgi:methenyltetrahydromethanopterin cyclohydrolase